MDSFNFFLISAYPQITNTSPTMKITLLFLNIPYETADIPIIHTIMIGYFLLRIYDAALNAIITHLSRPVK